VALAKSSICQGCWGKLRLPIPIRGPLALPWKMLGVRISRMHPNLCTLCETKFKLLMRVPQVRIAATILFADLRGYTGMSQRLEGLAVSDLLSEFYEAAAGAIWEQDGIVNKLMGDAVLAVFNFPMERPTHVARAVRSAVALQAGCAGLAENGPADSERSTPVGVGVGLHTGTVSIGEIGHFCRDFTVIGEVVNLAARLQGAARPGEILVTDEVYREVEQSYPGAERRVCELKGIAEPVSAYVLTSQR
jgi:adenylate cyclase